MEKSVVINIPEGYKIDKEKSTFEKIVLKKKEEDYNSISEKLFCSNCTYYITNHGDILDCVVGVTEHVSHNTNNCTSKKQAEKLLAINKLMNVAKYLNGDWKPDWFDGESKFYLRFDHISNVISIGNESIISSEVVFFKTPQLAKEAIEILGEETIKLALSTDW